MPFSDENFLESYVISLHFVAGLPERIIVNVRHQRYQILYAVVPNRIGHGLIEISQLRQVQDLKVLMFQPRTRYFELRNARKKKAKV